MIDEYQQYLVKVISEVSKIGFRLIDDSDYFACFENDAGWKLTL